MAQKWIVVKGARQHNLKNIDVSFPKSQLSVVTGPSGSGKSSLAFNTVFAEGQRRYLESLSTYARQFLDKQEKPDVDEITGLSPTIAIEQKNHTKSSRSTVGTATEIYDYLRLIYSKMGVMYCLDTGEPVKRDLIPYIIRDAQANHEGERAYICYPFDFAAKTKVSDRKRILATLLERGFTEAIPATSLDKLKTWKMLDIQSELAKKKTSICGATNKPCRLFVAVDRLVVDEESRGRFEDALSTAYGEGYGRCKLVICDQAQKIKFQSDYTEFPSAGGGLKRYPELTPALFSFNTPMGACPKCKGFGNIMRLDPSLVIPNEDLTVAQGAIEPFTKPSCKHWLKDLLLFCQSSKVPLNKPWKTLTEPLKEKIWKGYKDYPGIEAMFEQLNEDRYKVEIKVFISRYRSPFPCDECGGERLRAEARSVKFHKKSIGELSAMTVEDLAAWFAKLKITKEEKEIGKDLFPQISGRLEFLLRVGLDYLSMNRLAKTLSGGEAQRIALANQLASRLTQTTYVLDEPSIGLHPRDTEKLVGIMHELTELNNTVIVVEHDPDIIKRADYLFDIGPDAGENGGELVFSGKYETFINTDVPKSITSQFMRGKEQIPVPTRRRTERFKDMSKTIQWVGIKECTEHNLQNVELKIPLHMMTCITGVSGSGKSTAIRHTLYPALCKRLLLKAVEPGAHTELSGYQDIRAVKLIDQAPIGRSPRSNPITFIKSFDAIRTIFASTRDARKRRFHAGHFSFNVPGGRCEDCDGEGYNRVEMVFMEDIFLKCDICDGKRFKEEILKIYYNGKNIHDVLNMTVSEACEFFKTEKRLSRNLNVLRRVGLGYLRLGQPSNTLSGGECQRLKIARELLTSQNTGILYVLDEPTTGLHFRDVKILIRVLHELVERGNTAIVIEHNTEVMKASDWMIDFGPGGGVHGGKIIAQGTPEKVATNKKSYTAKYLSKVLKNSPKMTLTRFMEQGDNSLTTALPGDEVVNP